MQKDFQLIDTTKIGSLILSYYRCGTHFLQDAILAQCSVPRVVHNEICDDGTIRQLQDITNRSTTKDSASSYTDGAYQICILNNPEPKFYLRNATDFLSQWHTIKLTRNNKIEHFISTWFWEYNFLEQRIDNTGMFFHHGTPEERYRQQVEKIGPVSLDPSVVIGWLQNQLILDFIAADVVIDYDDLETLSSTDVKWSPNQYNVALSDLFINHKEVEDLLLRHTWASIKSR